MMDGLPLHHPLESHASDLLPPPKLKVLVYRPLQRQVYMVPKTTLDDLATNSDLRMTSI